MIIKIKEGHYYRCVDGKVVGPAKRVNISAAYPWQMGENEMIHYAETVYTEDGSPKDIAEDLGPDYPTEVAQIDDDLDLEAKAIWEKAPEIQKAVKHDTGKPVLGTWPKAMLEVGKASAIGVAKYGTDMNYIQGDTIGTYRACNSALRHIYAYLSGEDVNTADGDVHHLAHAAAAILMALEIQLRKPKGDNRWKED